MAARRCKFVDAQTGKTCPIFARGDSEYCIHHRAGAISTMTDDEKLSLLEHEMRCVRHKNARALERTKLLLALMAVHDRITKGGDAAPEVPDHTGVEDLDWKEREKRIKAEARATKHR